MKILNVSEHADTGGVSINTKMAFNRIEPSWDYRAACRTSNYIDYPKDLAWDDVYAHWVASDVVHVAEWLKVQDRLNAPNRPMVVHQHGTVFRRNPARTLREMHKRKAVGLAATLDLYLDAPDDLRWMPAPYNIRHLHRIRELSHHPRDGVFRVGHNPTNRAIKSTDLLIEAVEKLKTELRIELVLTERVSWEQSLRAKTSVDVYFDQVKLGYGNNAIESWAMGIPVIAGAADPTLREMEARFGKLPFYRAEESVSSIMHAIEMLADPVVHAKWSAVGRAHAQQWHSEEAVVPLLQAVYEEVAR